MSLSMEYMLYLNHRIQASELIPNFLGARNKSVHNTPNSKTEQNIYGSAHIARSHPLFEVKLT